MTKKLPPRVFSLSMRIPTIFSEAFSLSLSLSLSLYAYTNFRTRSLSLYTYHLFGSVIVLLTIIIDRLLIKGKGREELVPTNKNVQVSKR